MLLTSPPQTPEDVFQWRDIGNYSVCGFRVSLRRRSFKFIFNNYIPGALFVLVSWVSFLIPPDLIPGRCRLRTTICIGDESRSGTCALYSLLCSG